MKISQLTKALNYWKKQNGDLPVFLSVDSEGNSFSDLGEKPEDSIHADKEKIVLFPYREGLELDFKE